MQVYLVRHAEAASGEPDELRSLTPAGREVARALGEQLAADGVRPDAILTSPLLRARETGAAVGRLAPGATADDLRAVVAGRGEIVVVVGHQPDCGQIYAALTGEPEPKFRAGGMQKLELP
jgi:phosphohistidine phosphatase